MFSDTDKSAMDSYKIFLVTILISLTVINTYANCRGCCSSHKGVTCSNGVTQCRDGSSLSDRCQRKSCNKCEGTVSKVSTIISNKTNVGKYNRKLFRHWIDEDSDCQNTRAEVLIKYNIGTLQFKSPRNCVVVSGKWKDSYSGKIFTRANDLDVDHIIPLAKAFSMGASKWTPGQRKRFANDYDNLLPVWKRLNRQKGAKGPSNWMPPKEDYRCKYLAKWKSLKQKYQLQQVSREIASIDELASLCEKSR